MQDFGFELPEQLTASQPVWQVVNKGPPPHEIALFKLAEGKTMDDVMTMMTGCTVLDLNGTRLHVTVGRLPPLDYNL